MFFAKALPPQGEFFSYLPGLCSIPGNFFNVPKPHDLTLSLALSPTPNFAKNSTNAHHYIHFLVVPLNYTQNNIQGNIWFNYLFSVQSEYKRLNIWIFSATTLFIFVPDVMAIIRHSLSHESWRGESF